MVCPQYRKKKLFLLEKVYTKVKYSEINLIKVFNPIKAEIFGLC